MVSPRTTTIIYDHNFNPNYDIVWSVQFLLSGNNNSSGAFTTFLSDTTTITGGGSGIDVGYSGVPGLSGTKLAVGFDTTGLFASSFTYPNSSTRDGIDPQPNMLVIRGGYPNFNLIFASPLSALSDSFNLVYDSEIYQTLRFRLGNVGRTLHVDWRPTNDTSYTQLTSVNVNLDFNDTSLYYIGYSFTTPVSVVDNWGETVLFLKSPLYEGVQIPPSYTTIDFTPITPELCDECLLPTVYFTVTADIPGAPIYDPIRVFTVFTDCNQDTNRLLYVNRENSLKIGPLSAQDPNVEVFKLIPYNGSFVTENTLYTVESGFVVSSVSCDIEPYEPYEPQVPVLFHNIPVKNKTDEEHDLLSQLFS